MKQLCFFMCLFMLLPFLKVKAQEQSRTEKPEYIMLKLTPEALTKHSKVMQQLKLLGEAEAAFKRAETNADYAASKPSLPDFFIKIRTTDPEKTLAELNAADFTDYAEPVYAHQLHAPPFIPNDPSLGLQWSLSVIKAYEAWGITRGNDNTVIGIIDTGITKDHPDLRNKLFYNEAEVNGIPNFDDDFNGYVDDTLAYDFGDRDNDVTDSHYHGTSVAGIAAASQNDGIGMAGIAGDCKIMPVKVYSSSFEVQNLYEGILYAAQNGCGVINVSIGRPNIALRWEEEIINYITEELNVLIVASAGNFSAEINYYPASYKNVLSVTHTDAQDTRGSNAAYNTEIDLAAPGVGIYTTFNADYQSRGTSYFNLSGSSFASPTAAGAAALIRSGMPELSALQVAELLRVSGENHYSAAGNASFTGKLGTSRLNIYRALTMKDSLKSVRMTDFYPSDGVSRTALSGDTISIFADFTNYLSPTSAGAEVKLQSADSEIMVLDSIAVLGEIATGGIRRELNAFRVVISESVPADYEAKLLLVYSDEAYTDRQYFTLKVNGSYLNADFNDLSMTVTNNGRFGFLDEQRGQGEGLRHEGKSILKHGGLIISNRRGGRIRIPDAVVDTLHSSASNDFSANRAPFTEESTPFYKSVISNFSDNPLSSDFIGLNIRQKTWGQTNEPNHEFLIIEYEITNTSSQFLDSLNVALFTDFDINGGANNFARWENFRNFGYVFQSGQGYAAVQALDDLGVRHFFAFDLNKVSNPGIDITDNFSKEEKYNAMTGGIARTSAGGSTGNDVALLSGSTLYAFEPNETQTIRFAILHGSTLADIYDNLEAAERLTDRNLTFGERPFFNNTVCLNESVLEIAPGNGTDFAFYEAPNTKTPVYTGSAKPFSSNDLGKTFYVTNLDEDLEGVKNYIEVSPELHTPNADFDFIRTLNIDDSAFVHFTDLSLDAIAWEWDFGDETSISFDENPAHEFDSIGVYTVSLIMTDRFGCRDTVEKVLKIFDDNRPLPGLPSSVEVCDEESVLINPVNASNFRFYDAPNGNLLHEGENFSLSDPSVSKVYVTNADQSIETEPVSVNIIRYDLNADWQSVPRADTVFFEEVTFTSTSTHDVTLTSRLWDFGDGSLPASGNTVTHTYSSPGAYNVSLTITDIKGCTETVIKEFRIGEKAADPVLPEVLNACVGVPFEIIPGNGTNFRFYKDEPFSEVIHEGTSLEVLYETLVTEVYYVTCTDKFVESEPVRFEVSVKTQNADFTFERELNLSLADTVRFTDNSPGAVSWSWDFGNGQTSEERNPVGYFAAEGTYEITLNVTNEFGCTAQRKKTLTAFNISPVPQVHDIYLCRGDSVSIIPEGGTNFLFYDNPDLETPLHSGRMFNVGWVQTPRSFFVVCADSAVNSSPAVANIYLSRPFASFEISTDTVNTFLSDTLYLYPENTDAESIYWNFGNGTVSREPTSSITYEVPGTYDITLLAFDSLGCTDSATRRVVVIDTPFVKTFEPGKDYGVLLYPNPSTDYINLVVTAKSDRDIGVLIYDTAGREILRRAATFSINRFFRFDFRRLNGGMYIAKIKVGNEFVYKRFVVH